MSKTVICIVPIFVRIIPLISALSIKGFILSLVQWNVLMNTYSLAASVSEEVGHHGEVLVGVVVGQALAVQLAGTPCP